VNKYIEDALELNASQLDDAETLISMIEKGVVGYREAAAIIKLITPNILNGIEFCDTYLEPDADVSGKEYKEILDNRNRATDLSKRLSIIETDALINGIKYSSTISSYESSGTGFIVRQTCKTAFFKHELAFFVGKAKTFSEKIEVSNHLADIYFSEYGARGDSQLSGTDEVMKGFISEKLKQLEAKSFKR
jgi:hypothetical protein